MAGHDDARPLEAITVKKQAYLPVGAGPDMDHCGFKIAESLENGRSQIVWRTRNAMEHALFRPQPRENRRISKLCARGGGRTHQETDTPHRTAQCYPQARILSYNPKYLGPHRCNKNKNPRICEGHWLGCLDSNQEWLNQNQLCCQLHHIPIWLAWQLRKVVRRTPNRI